MKTQGFHHIQIDVSDLDRSLAFYEGLMGMKEQFRGGPNLVFLQTPGANDLLTLHRVDGPVDTGKGGLEHFGFSIRREDREAALAEVRSFGAEILDIGWHGDEQSGTPYAYIKDPDGYTIELD